MKRGELWWATLAAPIGRRPVVVVQSNTFNDSRIRTVLVALATSNLAFEKAPGNVRLSQGEGGVPKVSVVNVSQLYAMERVRLTSRLGALPEPVLRRVDAGLRLVLGLSEGSRAGVMDSAAHYAVRKRVGRGAARLRARIAARGYKRDKLAEDLIRQDRDSR